MNDHTARAPSPRPQGHTRAAEPTPDGPTHWAWDAGATFLFVAAPFTDLLHHAGSVPFGADGATAFALLAIGSIGVAMAARLAGTFGRILLVAVGVVLFIDLRVGLATAGIPVRVLFLGTVLLATILRHHVTAIATVTLGTMLVASLAMGTGSERTQRSSTDEAVRSTRLPVVLHVVLDEHAGLDSLHSAGAGTASVAEWIEDRYVARGFLVQRHSYSRYFQTLDALSNGLNFEDDPRPGHWLENGSSLRVNEYFRRAAALGYRIHVVQPEYIDYCSDSDIASCTTYPHATFDGIHRADAGTLCRGVLLLRESFSPGVIARFVQRKLNRVSAALTARLRSSCGAKVPEWVWWGSAGVASFESLAALERLQLELPSARPGDLFFAHILLPHYPYALDANCGALPFSEWLHRKSRHQEAGGNDVASRATHYRAYAAQVRCTHRALERVLDALPTGMDTRIILHGDHGSRIGINDPVGRLTSSLTDTDLADGFSTFFATLTPGGESGPSAEPRALEELLATSLAPLGLAPETGAGPTSPSVFLRDRGKTMVRMPYSPPDLGNARTEDAGIPFALKPSFLTGVP